MTMSLATRAILDDMFREIATAKDDNAAIVAVVAALILLGDSSDDIADDVIRILRDQYLVLSRRAEAAAPRDAL